ncbi:hypothetical protein ACFZCY_42750 [Streptomyces sp. NPDC007983]|uniref:hypothetical protein n=1 Tax=Streptomyces sp. NPDC007983 TaxID=3364800 RepID=UPI0036E402F7
MARDAGAVAQDSRRHATEGLTPTRDDAAVGRQQASPSAAASVDAVLRLAEGLPDLERVRAVDDYDASELTKTEQRQKEQTEKVIGTALAAGDAAVWVIAQALERAAKGRWWRRSHDSLGAYIQATIGRSAVYGRQLRKNAPLALETAQRTGSVPKPSQVEITWKTERRHGRNAAVTLYEAVRDVTAELGGRLTADCLEAVHHSLPDRLPKDPEQQRTVIEQTARRALRAREDTAPLDEAPEPVRWKGLWPLRFVAPASCSPESTPAPMPITEANDSAPIGASGSEEREGDACEARGGLHDAEPVAACLTALHEALGVLNALDRAVTEDVFARAAAGPGAAAEYEKLRHAIIAKTTAIRSKALKAPPG